MSDAAYERLHRRHELAERRHRLSKPAILEWARCDECGKWRLMNEREGEHEEAERLEDGQHGPGSAAAVDGHSASAAASAGASPTESGRKAGKKLKSSEKSEAKARRLTRSASKARLSDGAAESDAADGDASSDTDADADQKDSSMARSASRSNSSSSSSSGGANSGSVSSGHFYCGRLSSPSSAECARLDDWLVQCVGAHGARALLSAGIDTVDRLSENKALVAKVHQLGMYYDEAKQTIKKLS
jgi:hypothetical protein